LIRDQGSGIRDQMCIDSWVGCGDAAVRAHGGKHGGLAGGEPPSVYN
jgi:hypothetical protein